MAFTETFPFSFYTPSKYLRPFTLEVRTADGELVRALARYLAGEMTVIVNEPGELTVTVDRSDETADILGGDNQIWVRDAENEILGQYRVARREESGDRSGRTITLTCRGPLSDLAAEPLDMYSATDTISNHLTAWFAGQVGLQPLVLGDVASAIGDESRTLDFSGPSSILEAINALEKTLADDTIFWVDTDRTFHWALLSSIDERGFTLRLEKNVTQMERTVDYDRQATRLYARGKNVEGQYVRLSQADGASNNYVQSAIVTRKYRRQIVIDHLTVGALGETDMSLNYVLESDTHLAAHAESDGSDIEFLASADAQSYLTSTVNTYTAATGALDATVTVPTVSGGYDTVIYMVYGL